LAAQKGHLSVVEYLVNQKADINAKDKNDWTPLHYAAQKGHLSVVEYLVNQKADINTKDEDNKTPLHYAARYGHLSVVEYLVNHGADIHEMNSCLGTSHIISDSNIAEFLKTMQIRNERVFDACKVGNLQDIFDFLQKNFFIDTKHNGVCLVHVAAEQGHLSVVEYLVNHKADINAKDNCVEFLYFIRLLFIMLLIMAILVLLNI